MWLVYTPPVTYKRAKGAEGTELIPGLAEKLPEISDDGRTVTFKFRDGLRFSDGTPLRASDFEHTIKRVLNLESGGSAFYGDRLRRDLGVHRGSLQGLELVQEAGHGRAFHGVGTRQRGVPHLRRELRRAVVHTGGQPSELLYEPDYI